jgi:hypothetical protein
MSYQDPGLPGGDGDLVMLTAAMILVAVLVLKVIGANG